MSRPVPSGGRCALEHHSYPPVPYGPDAFGNIGTASASLNMHPNSFRYRLRQLRRTTDCDLEVPDTRFRLMLHLRLLCLKKPTSRTSSRLFVQRVLVQRKLERYSSNPHRPGFFQDPYSTREPLRQRRQYVSGDVGADSVSVTTVAFVESANRPFCPRR
ncbi:helix-turn-helix domain-containing protein [Rhodococcus qingshengii]|uniref:helix-turn-helix domain-containing protein n=1 Tax=Rhodococcus erythropolis TaxID=1833 RepID=UPI0035AEF8C0